MIEVHRGSTWRTPNQIFESLSSSTIKRRSLPSSPYSLSLSPSSLCSPFSPSPLFLPSPSWHSALSLIVDNWVGGAVGRPCLCVQRASGQVNGALVSSWEHSVSLFLYSITHSASQSQSLSQLLFSSVGEAFPCCFDLVSPHFQLSLFASPSSHSGCLSHFFFLFLLCLLVFFSLSISLSLSLPLSAAIYLSSLSLRQSVGEERTDLFKISKDRSGGLAGPSLSTNSPSLLLTDKQKSEPAGLAAVYCLSSLLHPSLFSSCGEVDCWLVLIYVCVYLCVLPCLAPA